MILKKVLLRAIHLQFLHLSMNGWPNKKTGFWASKIMTEQLPCYFVGICSPFWLSESIFLFVSFHVLFESIAFSAWVVTAATLVRLLSSVSVGMSLQITSWSAWVVTAGTLVRLLPSVGVGMFLQVTRLSTWKVTALTLERLLHSVAVGMFLQ